MKNMKKMKLYAVISPLCILFAQSALTVQAQKIDDSQLRLAGGKILIDSVLTQKKSDSLKVAFRLHLDSLQLKSEQQLVFTPLIAGYHCPESHYHQWQKPEHQIPAQKQQTEKQPGSGSETQE